MFGIIEFFNAGTKNEIAVAPIIWTRDGNRCLWPPHRSSEKLKVQVKNCEQPDETKWGSFPARIMHVFDTYEEAIKRLPHAEEYSDFSETESPLTKRTITLPSRFQESSTEETLPSDINRTKKVSFSLPVPPTPNITQSSMYENLFEDNFQANEKTYSCQSVSESQLLFLQRSQSQPHVNEERLTLTPQKLNSGFEDFVIKSLTGIKLDIEQLHKRFTQMENKFESLALGSNTQLLGREEQNISYLLSLIPTSTIEEMTLLISHLNATPESHLLLAQHMARAGGDSCKEAVNRMMKKVVSDKLACQYNMSGTGGKLCFNDLILKEVVLKALLLNPLTKSLADEKVCSSSLAYWLKHANGRLTKARSKTQSEQN